MVWTCLPFVRSGQNHLAKHGKRGEVDKEGNKTKQNKKRWEDNIKEWTGLEFAKSQRAVENREKMEETGCEIICGAPTTLAVKGIGEDGHVYYVHSTLNQTILCRPQSAHGQWIMHYFILLCQEIGF